MSKFAIHPKHFQPYPFDELSIRLPAPRALINWPKRIEKLLNDGRIEECPLCRNFSAYSYQDVSLMHGIFKIGATSSFEWQCGNCHTFWIDKDSPLNCECYTHNPHED